METPPCDICGGTGEVNYFKGVSRFLLSHEICPACHGSGFAADDNTDETESGDKNETPETDK